MLKYFEKDNLSRLFLLCAALGAVATILVFSPGLGGGFFFDDKPNIIQNVSLYMMGLDHVSMLRAAVSFSGAPGSRALPMLSFGLDYFRAGGFDPVVFKSTNIAIHAVTTIVLAGFLRLLMRTAGYAPRWAFVAALAVAFAWAMHPLQVSSVLYVVQRMQTLATLFIVLALWAYLRMRLAQIGGRNWRADGGYTLLFGLLALACKEDSVLLPAFALILEFTVLNFCARSPAMVALWKRTYAVLLLLGAAIYFFWILPRYWSWSVIPGRDFTIFERVLSQGRVLSMYLGQIFWPAPDGMRFYYDDYPVSHGLMQPLSTLMAWLLLLGLLLLGWGMRRRRPLLAAGILLFFAGHFVASNVIALELVFEHRNHFPMIGAVLAFSDLCVAGFSRLRRGGTLGIVFCVAVLAGCAGNTVERARIWGDNLELAKESVRIAPGSGRAWTSLCRAYYDLSRGDTDSPYFDEAINACQRGGEVAGSVMALANVVIFKTLRDGADPVDWQRLLAGLGKVTLSPENVAVAMNMVGNARGGIPLDSAEVLAVVEVVRQRRGFSFGEYDAIARYLDETAGRPEDAYRYLIYAMRSVSPGDSRIPLLLGALEKKGRNDWAVRLRKEITDAEAMRTKAMATGGSMLQNGNASDGEREGVIDE